MLDKILDEPLSSWLRSADPIGDIESHIVLSSRIRLARNFKGLQFTNRNHIDSLQAVEQMMRGVLGTLKAVDGCEYSNISLDKLSSTEREILVEKHLMSPQMSEKLPYRSLVVAEDASVAIMVNEEDHIRIQSMKAGLHLQEALARALKIDDAIESKYDYAFSEQYGYLTACPTNVGTGMRASAMLHLPALGMTGRINRLVRNITQLGYSVRGLYGEGSQALGNIYQISNQVTMGISEEDTVTQLQKVLEKLVQEEVKARQAIKSSDFEVFEDRIWRAFGTLQYARRLSGEEALALLSDVQLGMDLGVLSQHSADVFNELVVTTRPNFLSKYAGKESMTTAERDSYRAKVVRDRLAR